jgi:uncharacterized protein (DUF1800 family)
MRVMLATLTFLVAAPAFAASTPPIAWADRLTWGGQPAPTSDMDRWLDAQLARPDDRLPPAIQAQVDAMRISREPVAALVVEEEAANKAANQLTDPAQRDAARKAYQGSMTALANEAATRSLYRDIYAPDQLREQLTWFWFNHFNVQAQKRDVRAMVGDYEDVIRAHALGRFRDLLLATLEHPAMLRYLDNDQNAASHINENYARELMELHTLGVGAGYTQGDVQELARVLTGVGVDLNPTDPKLSAQRAPLLVRAGLFEFNPNRHDFGDKQLLGHAIKGRGFAEVEEAVDLLARDPRTARHVSTQLATYFAGDPPPPALVDRMTKAWARSDGDIATVLRAMAHAPEFRASLGGAFKDPLHYAVSAVRLAYGDRVIVNTQPITGWLNRMGEGLYAHETPDGYPLAAAAWTGPGQMAVRFEIARQIGGGAGGLFRPPAPPADPMVATGTPMLVNVAAIVTPSLPPPPSPPPAVKDGLYVAAVADRLAAPTRAALAQASGSGEWNALFLSSPEFMRR